jgi:CheY-like chemotaxis protein
MKEQTRRTIFRYGIAIDLVILATGMGMFVPPTAALLIFIYAAAVALSMWRGGWAGSAVALFLSLVALMVAFPAVATPAHLVMLAASGIAGAALVQWATRPRTSVEPEVVVERVTGPVAVPATFAEEARSDGFAQQPLERSPLEPAPLAEVVSLHESRAEAERVRLQEEMEARLALERQTAQRELEAAQRELETTQRELAERLAEERRAVEEERERAEAARVAAEQEAELRRADTERLEAARIAAEQEAERQRVETERRAAEIEAERQRLAADRARLDAEIQERLAQERESTQRELQERLEAERHAAEEDLRRQLEVEREFMRAGVEQELAAEREQIAAARQSVTAERDSISQERESVSAERERLAREADERLETERARIARDAEERVAAERERIEQEARERVEQETRERVEQETRERVEQETRERVEQETRERIEQETRERVEQEALERVAAAQAAAEVPPVAPPPPPAAHAPVAKAAPPPPPKPSLVDTLTGWFRREERPRTVNLKNKRLATNTTPVRRTQPLPASRTSMPSASAVSSGKPRLLLIERRRATADTVTPKLRHRGVEIQVVERWVDAVDEIFRFKPHALFLDIEHPEFDRMHRTVTEKTSQLPIVLTGRAGSTPPSVRRAAFVGRPYDDEEVARIAQLAQSRPEDLLAEQSIPRAMARVAPATMVATPSLRAPVVPKPSASQSAPSVYNASPSAKPITNDEYEITCFTCRAPFNAIDADWCSCLAKERTLVCTNCLACFCKAPPAYKEKFWVAAPPRLFERKTAEARKQGALLPANALRADVKRPLVLTVEDDEEIQAIVQRVCANLDYGFIWATNGQDGLELAREYRPNMILSDAFMPKLDGREMCRILKEDPTFADTPMVVMTGLYTDTKYRSEAVKRFHVDDYVAKPVAITDLINLLQKHLEGVTGLPMQEDLHELHRQNVDLHEQLEGEAPPLSLQDPAPIAEVLAGMTAEVTEDIELSDVMLAASEMVPIAKPRSDAYEVCCFNCQSTFDATHAEWCSCVGRDNTLLCEHCGGCFCKAPAAYRERFWIDAPPSLFERKMIGSKRNLGARSNPAPTDVKRPLILLVEDDENVQLIVRTVVSNMGYGFVVGADGQEGLTLAREYGPDMILSDAFMPKLDGREMCRLLKEDPTTARSKAVIMTGLYTDRKYRNEALDYFKVDDYVAKPLAVDDLIKLFKKHLPQEVTTAH